ncbi:ABC transporter substrate-binding protein [Pigmentiphaga soli]|uniref:ABC transporter substrate-binding protein n=1 Tax=Pigmentiphaga soli TaxID=1007095 RepID=A0ABP8GQN6_9BURK
MREIRIRALLDHRKTLGGVVGAALLASAGAVFAQVPDGYPADYTNIANAAKKEGKVVIYTSTDLSQVNQLKAAFEKRYPGVSIEFNDLGTSGTYNRIISEAAAGQTAADLAWTNAMDQQIKLVADGYAQPYKSPESKNLPDWAIYENTAYGTTVEPLTLGYNTALMKKEDVPKTRAALTKYINDNAQALNGKVATFDPEKVGSGFLFHTYDLKHLGNSFWDLAKAFGKANGRLYSSTGQLREKLVSGEHILVFNLIGSYALDWAKTSPTLGVAFTEDYTQTFSRPLFITKDAPHPNAARLFLDFILSKDGQRAMAQGGIPSIRNDVGDGVLSIKQLDEMAHGHLVPIHIDAALLEYQEPKKRTEFLRTWNKAIGR